MAAGGSKPVMEAVGEERFAWPSKDRTRTEAKQIKALTSISGGQERTPEGRNKRQRNPEHREQP